MTLYDGSPSLLQVIVRVDVSLGGEVRRSPVSVPAHSSTVSFFVRTSGGRKDDRTMSWSRGGLKNTGAERK